MNKKKVFSISVQKAGKEVDSITLPPSLSHLTIGTAPGSNLNVLIPGFPDSYMLIEKKWPGYCLLLHPEMDGLITIGANSFPVRGIIDLRLVKKKKEHYMLPVTPDAPFSLKVGDITLSFSFRNIPRQEALEIPRLLRKPLISRDDYAFLAILLLSAAINFSAANYLNKIQIKKTEPLEVIKNIPARFARLILNSPAAISRSGTTKKEDALKRKEEPRKKEGEKEGGGEVAMMKRPSADTGRATDTGERVMSKGLLGVIMAKGKPAFMDDSLFEAGEPSRSGLKGIDNLPEGSGDVHSDLGINRLGKTLGLKDGREGGKNRSISDVLKEKESSLPEPEDREKTVKKDITVKRKEADVYKTVYSYTGGVKYLYNNALRKDASLKGKLMIKLAVSENGKVVNVEKVSSTLSSPELEEAIIMRVYKWQFPEVKGAGDFAITYTFDFSPTG